MNKKEIEQIEKDNEDIMKRMSPAVMIPGFFIRFMVLVGCIFKGYMGW
jgi:membrane-anchored glycerophosphoryl diester phosphodiesterase (GDPDase)